MSENNRRFEQRNYGHPTELEPLSGRELPKKRMARRRNRAGLVELCKTTPAMLTLGRRRAVMLTAVRIRRLLVRRGGTPCWVLCYGVGYRGCREWLAVPPASHRSSLRDGGLVGEGAQAEARRQVSWEWIVTWKR